MGDMLEVIPLGEQDSVEDAERTETKKPVTYDIPDNSQDVSAVQKADEAQIAHILEVINALPDFARTEKGEKTPEIKPPEVMGEGVEGLLLATEALNEQLDREVAARFGEGFYESLRAWMSSWAESLLKKGDDAVSRIEAKGIWLPKTKAGMRVLAGVLGATGAVAPGGIVTLLPLSLVLWKRAGNI